MPDVVMYLLIATVITFLVYRAGKRALGLDGDVIPGLGLRGKVIWKDEGSKTRAMHNETFGIFGKGDFLVQLSGGRGLALVEFKSRARPVFASDWVQGMAAALAARGSGYPVEWVVVKTGRSQEEFRLPKSDSALFSKISGYVREARSAKDGQPVSSLPAPAKCVSCAYSSRCSHKKLTHKRETYA